MPLRRTEGVGSDGREPSGSRDTNAVVVKPGPFFGEGGALNRAGIPTIGYIPLPEYLCAAPAEDA